MTVDHQAQVDELVAGYRRSREQLASVQQALAAVRAAASSEDGLVTATVGPGGVLAGLTIDERAYRTYRPDELAALIVRTTAVAARLAARSAEDLVAPLLPSGADPAALLHGSADLTPAELAPPAVAAEESFENQTWMRRGGVEDQSWPRPGDLGDQTWLQRGGTAR
ncbi:YbaB/EbfC family nucleoid-associated protein [Actinophytocola sp.]|uniref:YbaB/EbfC family nucleoid-associated protein n=1 Tax=Actinophytocola sp. TaxID=1872138 RepID=UPI002D7EB0F5|nr:YbaB/EbfC family nucleoid-associated protein [Actinophytocola sp.]HET9143170.1 YbaB/EbfC family nucleoid-associated protein [Actinophytocola sp.]